MHARFQWDPGLAALSSVGGPCPQRAICTEYSPGRTPRHSGCAEHRNRAEIANDLPDAANSTASMLFIYSRLREHEAQRFKG
jgi:hypothetical protein